jgi:hypothetical protein
MRQLHSPRYPTVFSGLSISTVREWFDENFKLLAKVKARWMSGAPAKRGISRSYALAQESVLEDYLIRIFQKRRDSGQVVNSIVAASIFRSILTQRAPHLLQRMSLSRRWVRQWLQFKCGFTYKKATTSGQKLPEDWEAQVSLMIDRAAAVIATHKVAHPSLVINWDQSAVILMPSPMYTYHSKKDKHVGIVGQDEKRQVTAVVAGTLSGELLPLQMIFTGQDSNALKQKSVPELPQPLASRIISDGWHLTQTKNHWSSQKSMIDYVERIIDPWVLARRTEHRCPESHVLLLFDCWSVHKSAEFLGWMKTQRPTIMWCSSLQVAQARLSLLT